MRWRGRRSWRGSFNSCHRFSATHGQQLLKHRSMHQSARTSICKFVVQTSINRAMFAHSFIHHRLAPSRRSTISPLQPSTMAITCKRCGKQYRHRQRSRNHLTRNPVVITFFDERVTTSFNYEVSQVSRSLFLNHTRRSRRTRTSVPFASSFSVAI